MSQTKQRKPRLTRQILEDELDRARIRRVNVTEDMLTLYLKDEQVLGMPTVWSPCLSDVSEAERQNHEIIGHGVGAHWPDLDEYVSVHCSAKTPLRWRERIRCSAEKSVVV